MSRRTGLLAAAVVAASLASASSAQAINVDGIGYPNGPGDMLSLGNATAGERNAITIEPSGAAFTDPEDLETPLAPTTLVVTDTETPLGTVGGSCVRIDAHSARCTSAVGFIETYADLGDGAGNSFVVRPAPTGAATPMRYELYTRDGDDRVSIPSARWLRIETMGGNDTITATNEGSWGADIRSGAGDDQVELVAANGFAQVWCGDGIDSALVTGNVVVTHDDCETRLPDTT